MTRELGSPSPVSPVLSSEDLEISDSSSEVSSQAWELQSCILIERLRPSGTKNLTFRETQPVAELGYKTYIKLEDFTNENDIQHVIRPEQNTVINCIGSRIYYKTEKEFEDANIRIPMAIANVVKRNP